MSIPSVSGAAEGSIDRLPPHSEEAEQGVLGCCLLSPNECIPELVAKFKSAGGDAFYDLRHQTIFTALNEMSEARQPIDLISLMQKLKDAQTLEQVGGIPYLSALQDAVPSAANLSYYADIVWEKFLLRKVIQTCTGVVGRIYDYEGDVDELLDESEQAMTSVSQLRVPDAVATTASAVHGAMARIERRYDSKGDPTGLLTGFGTLDRMIDGLHGGEMVIIAARPSMGKSSLMMNIAEHMALETKIPVGVFSLEMSHESLIERSIGSVARVNVRKPWELGETDFVKMANAQAMIHAASKLLQIDNASGLSILELRARARRMQQKHGIKALFIDYLTLLRGTSKKAKDNRQNEIAEISAGIKSLAKELNIPIVVLAQLNRELEKNNRKPKMSDLRESGSLEQDADLIAMLSCETDEDNNDKPIILPGGGFKMVLGIEKQRNGPTGPIYLEFKKEWAKFLTLSHFED